MRFPALFCDVEPSLALGIICIIIQFINDERCFIEMLDCVRFVIYYYGLVLYHYRIIRHMYVTHMQEFKQVESIYHIGDRKLKMQIQYIRVKMNAMNE